MEIMPSLLLGLFGIWFMASVRPLVGLVIFLVAVAMIGAL